MTVGAPHWPRADRRGLCGAARRIAAVLAAVVLAAAAATAATAGDAPVTASPPAAAKPPAPAHQSLRSNRPFAAPNPVAPRRFEGYPGAAPFRVLPQKTGIVLYPCSQCHGVMPPNPTPRALVAAPHVADLPHGNGRMWCLACHRLEQRDMLVMLDGTPVDFDDAHLVCGQCHGNRHRDWWFGAHGKRAATWSGERAIWNCTHCHDAHQPALAPRKPSKPPTLRAGLAPMPVNADHAHPPAVPPAGRNP